MIAAFTSAVSQLRISPMSCTTRGSRDVIDIGEDVAVTGARNLHSVFKPVECPVEFLLR
jgi:hypothetical protein